MKFIKITKYLLGALGGIAAVTVVCVTTINNEGDGLSPDSSLQDPLPLNIQKPNEAIDEKIEKKEEEPKQEKEKSPLKIVEAPLHQKKSAVNTAQAIASAKAEKKKIVIAQALQKPIEEVVAEVEKLKREVSAFTTTEKQHEQTSINLQASIKAVANKVQTLTTKKLPKTVALKAIQQDYNTTKQSVVALTTTLETRSKEEKIKKEAFSKVEKQQLAIIEEFKKVDADLITQEKIVETTQAAIVKLKQEEEVAEAQIVVQQEVINKQAAIIEAKEADIKEKEVKIEKEKVKFDAKMTEIGFNYDEWSDLWTQEGVLKQRLLNWKTGDKPSQEELQKQVNELAAKATSLDANKKQYDSLKNPLNAVKLAKESDDKNRKSLIETQEENTNNKKKLTESRDRITNKTKQENLKNTNAKTKTQELTQKKSTEAQAKAPIEQEYKEVKNQFEYAESTRQAIQLELKREQSELDEKQPLLDKAVQEEALLAKEIADEAKKRSDLEKQNQENQAKIDASAKEKQEKEDVLAAYTEALQLKQKTQN